MRKHIVVVALVVTALFGSLTAQKAEAQSVAGLKPFSEAANYMSLAGYLRLLILRQEGRWISREEAEGKVRAGG